MMNKLRDWSFRLQLLILPVIVGVVISWLGLLSFLVAGRMLGEETLKTSSTFSRLETQLEILVQPSAKVDSPTVILASPANFQQQLTVHYTAYKTLLANRTFSSARPSRWDDVQFQRLETLLATVATPPTDIEYASLSQEASTTLAQLSQIQHSIQQQNDARMRLFFWLAISTAILAVIASMLIAAPVIKRTRKTLASLRKASFDISDEISAGHDESGPPADSNDELGRLVYAFNDMRVRLQKHEIETQDMVDELEAAKEASENARRLQAEFLSNMSHELRTPMHAILNFANIGESKSDSITVEKSRHYFSRIATSGKRLLNLLDDLLDMAKLESGQMSFNIDIHDVQETVESAIAELEPLLKERELKIRVRLLGIDTAARFDPDKIFQVMTNLLSNAIKFSPEGKTITVTYHADTLKQGRRRSDTGRLAAICVSVSDEGAGIPDAEVEQIFDKFFQSSRTKTGAGGTGLGLAICKEIIEKHGGTIMAENNPGAGCNLSFLLPREPAISSVEHSPPE